jgi:PAS domain S-box-containing protein
VERITDALQPDSVVVVDARSGEIIFSSRYAERVVGRRLSDIADDFPMFHLDGRPYSFAERQVPRAISSGEQILEEDFFGPGSDGGRVRWRCSCWPVYGDGGRIVAAVAVTRDVTEQTRRHERLTYLSALLENSEDAVVATDERYFVTVWNKGAERLYGRNAAEAVGLHADEVAPANLSAEQRTELRRQLAENGRWRGEVAVTREDGTTAEVEVSAVALRGEHGDVTGYLGIHRDISERKRAERRLREAQRRTEAILESITDDFVAVDCDWRYTYINDRALRSTQEWLGRPITREELLGRSLWEVFPETVGAVPYVKYHQAVREGRSVEFETYFAAKDRWFETHVYPSESGLSIYFRTITERKRAEEETSRRADQQALVATLGLQALGSDDLQPLLDQAVGHVAHTLDVELVGIVEILPGRDQMLLRAGVGWTEGEVGEVTAVAGPGSLIHYTIVSGEPVVSEDLSADDRFEVSPILAGTGAVSGATVVIAGRDEPFGSLGVFSRARHTFSGHDLDFLQAVANVLATAVERAQAEARLEEVRDTERRRIARDLHDEALQDLTHALALAQGAGSSDGADALVPALKRVGGQLRGAIYDLRLEEQEGRPLRAQLEALVALHDAMAADCDIELDMLEGTPTTSLGRPGVELLRIVGEALTNARRHSGAGHVRVKTWGSEHEVRVEVADDGVGFDPAAAPPREGGTGIKGMGERAALIGADLTITSEPDAGSRVRVRLALVDDDRPERIRVLLVEDHAAVREAIAAMLEREPDFEVTAQAASLADARDLLDNVDVAVLDLGLPDGYGGDLIKELRAVNRHAQALVLSGSLDRADIARAVESGAAGTLNKTVHLDELVDAVRRLRRGETLLPLDEVVELLRYASHEREREYQDRQAIAQLTPRERDVLQALAGGLDSQAIADRLHISLRTERNHAANILAKLGVHSQLQALVFALRYGVVEIR